MPRQLHQRPRKSTKSPRGRRSTRRASTIFGDPDARPGAGMRERTIALARLGRANACWRSAAGPERLPCGPKPAGPTGAVAGIDPSAEMIAEARQKAAQANLDIDYRVATLRRCRSPMRPSTWS